MDHRIHAIQLMFPGARLTKIGTEQRRAGRPAIHTTRRSGTNHRDDIVPCFGAPCHHGSADKAAGAGHEHSHSTSFSCTSRSISRALSTISCSPKLGATPARIDR